MIERLSHVCDSSSSERTGFARACLTSCLKTNVKSERGSINCHTRQHVGFSTAAVLGQCGRVVVLYYVAQSIELRAYEFGSAVPIPRIAAVEVVETKTIREI